MVRRRLAGLKQGPGTVQWFEYGRPIDRFEGAFKGGTRTSFGRYEWPAGQRFEGHYDADVPNGWGTVTTDGTSFTGIWRRGCLVHQDKVIAIGVRLSSCTGDPSIAHNQRGRNATLSASTAASVIVRPQRLGRTARP
jgi:hypothetical protein